MEIFLQAVLTFCGWKAFLSSQCTGGNTILREVSGPWDTVCLFLIGWKAKSQKLQ